MLFVVFLIRISALPRWRVYEIILSQQNYKIVRALYSGRGVTRHVQYLYIIENSVCVTPNVEYCYRNAYEMSQRRLLNHGLFPVRSRAKEVIVLSVKVLL